MLLVAQSCCCKNPQPLEIGPLLSCFAGDRCGDARYRNRALISTATMNGAKCKDVDLREVRLDKQRRLPF